MAIHVRSTDTVRLKISAIIRRLVLLALCLSFLALTLPAVILYLKKIYWKGEPASSFVTYTPPKKAPKKVNKPIEKENMASESGSTAPPPSVALTSEISPYVMDIPASEGDMSEGLVSDGDSGFGLAGFGDGLGDGLGSGGFGDGEGDGDEGGRRVGYNDDIQVVLLLDASGSMQELFQAASRSMEEMLATLSQAKLNGKKTKVNVGIVIYGQSERNGEPIRLSPFSTQVRKIRSRLEKVQCTGSNEVCGAAIDFAVKNFPWNRRERDDMLKVIFVAGNETMEQGNVDYRVAIAAAAEQNIIVNTIHCGEPDEEWEQAAALGGGIGLTMDINNSSSQQAPSADEWYRLYKALHDCAPLPYGAPSAQKVHIDHLNKAAAPPKNSEAKMKKWLLENKQRILFGHEWDAIEVCRLTPPGEFSLASLGGMGNVPVSLRGKSEEEIVSTLQALAKKRQDLLDEYKRMKASGDLGSKILSVLQEQAAEKGITIEF